MLPKSEVERLSRRFWIEPDLDQRASKAVTSVGKAPVNRAYQSAEAQATGSRTLASMEPQAAKRTH